jgi:Tol biopolymer transport system component
VRFLVAAAIVLAAAGAEAGDPKREYRTVESDHFIIHYWRPPGEASRGLDDVARRVAVVAERAHRVLSPALDHQPSEKTLIYLTDDTDSANGFAGVLPKNAIQLYATAPDGFTELDDYDDWLYGLVAHEYTHILHLDTMSGLPNIYNAIFGKTWAPNQIMPRWVIEGIATYEESKRTAGGRNRGTRFDEQIRIAWKGGYDLRLDQVTGAPRQYPRSNAAYIYGSHFLQYVFDRFGDDTLRQMSHTSGSYAPPFAVNRQIAKVVGKPFTELYGDWKNYLRDKYSQQEMAAERRGMQTGRRLSTTAESNLIPKYSADGKELYWLAYDGNSLPSVRAMPVGDDATHSRQIVQIDAMGPFDLQPDGSLVYEQGRQYRAVYGYEDLFRWDARTGQQVRLTTGRRARDPAVSPDGRRVAYSQNERSESVLAVMDLAPDAPATVVWRGERYDQAYQPEWSPDGTRIAFSAWRHGGLRDILIVDVATGKIDEVTHDRAVDMHPVWSADGTLLYFDSDRTGISNIYAFDVHDRSTWQVTNVLGGAFTAEPSPDGTRLAFIASVPKGGYDLFEVAVDRASWLPAREYIDDRPPPIDVADDEAKVEAARPYRALESLAPRVWTLQLDSATNSANIQTNGADAVGLHGYSLAVGLDYGHGDVNVGASYGYFGLLTPLRAAMSRTLLERGGWRVDGVSKRYKEEDWSATLSVGIPFESRPSSSWTLAFDYDVDWFRLVEAPMGTLDPNMRVPTHPPTDYVQAGIATRVAFSTVRNTTFGLGPQSGFDGSVSLRLDHPALGAEYRNVTVSYAADRFQKLWGRSPVLSLRLVGAFRTGDLPRAGTYGLGGVPAQDVARSIVDSTRAASSGFLRGYPGRTVAGNQFHLLNLEYRQELWNIEHGLATLPVYLRRLHLAVLSDTGTAFDTTFDAKRDLRTSLGAALRVDAFFGYFVPGTFEIGYARGLTDGGINETWFLLTGSL